MAAVVQTPENKLIGPPSNTFSNPELRFNSLLDEDFCHSKLLTINYKATGTNFIAKAKGTLDFKGAHYSHSQPQTSSQLKLLTNIQGREVEARFDNRGIIRLWADLGVYKLGRPAFLSGKVKTDSTFRSLSYAVGLDWSQREFDFGTRIHTKNGGHTFLNQSVTYTRDNVRLGGIYKLSLATFLLSRANFFAIYRENDYRLYFQHDLRGKGLTGFGHLGKTTLAATYQANRTEYILKASHRANKPQDRLRVVFGAVTKLDNRSVVRAKINNQTKLAVSWKRDFNKNLSLVVGTQVRLTEPTSFTTSKVVPIPVGITLKLSQ